MSDTEEEEVPPWWEPIDDTPPIYIRDIDHSHVGGLTTLKFEADHAIVLGEGDIWRVITGGDFNTATAVKVRFRP